MGLVVALSSGLIFGIGLIISGMANPAKVLGFLDIAGNWDPSLAFVMLGAICVAAIHFTLAKLRKRSILGFPMQLPGKLAVTPRLVLGSAVFGVGWALAGLCPSPALVALGAGIYKSWGFVVAMLAGIALFELAERAKLGRTRV
ncbi:sulfur transport family protein [Paraburkholderia fungorum]|uniref:Sulfur transport family protein n=1 Tax=Paraburkholderia fungorum TaxID=134537 RepID=A0AAP5QJA4_9BURK|nr:DUF6691 family protein [Paraburkholderia fungorum]AJZ56887.1 sulfur transport family protein [Paraburkholderia fungorum]MDT8843262.1 YeeE/YedE thiosulfate transporter family protein [Paraburkholderia fungorum]